MDLNQFNAPLTGTRATRKDALYHPNKSMNLGGQIVQEQNNIQIGQNLINSKPEGFTNVENFIRFKPKFNKPKIHIPKLPPIKPIRHPEIRHGNRIRFRTVHGKYIRAYTGDKVIMGGAGSEEIWEVKDAGHGKFAFFSPVRKRFLRARHDKLDLSAPRAHKDDLPGNWGWERFIILPSTHKSHRGKIVLYNDNHKKMYYFHSNGNVHVSNNQGGGWEPLVPVPVGGPKPPAPKPQVRPPAPKGLTLDKITKKIREDRDINRLKKLLSELQSNGSMPDIVKQNRNKVMDVIKQRINELEPKPKPAPKPAPTPQVKPTEQPAPPKAEPVAEQEQVLDAPPAESGGGGWCTIL